MRKITAVIFLVLMIAAKAGFAQQQAVDLFVQGNHAYAQEHYDDAIKLYEQIIAAGKVSGPLFYNLGNAYFKQGDLGRAVLNYERAVEYIPRNTDLRANYMYARSLVQKMEGQDDGNIFQTIVRQHFQLYTVAEICWILAVLLAILAAVHLSSLYFSWRASRKFSAMIIIACILAFYGFALNLKIQNADHQAIVLKDVSVLFEPRTEATTHFMIFEGNRVKIIKVQDGWSKVERFDHKTGWVKSDMVEQI